MGPMDNLPFWNRLLLGLVQQPDAGMTPTPQPAPPPGPNPMDLEVEDPRGEGFGSAPGGTAPAAFGVPGPEGEAPFAFDLTGSMPDEVPDDLMQKVGLPAAPPRLRAAPVEAPVPEVTDIPEGLPEVPATEGMEDTDVAEPNLSLPEQREPSTISAYRELLGQQPRREDFQHSFKDKLLAGLAGSLAGARDPRAGLDLTRGMLDRPFEQARSDWKERLQGAQTAATLDTNRDKTDAKREEIRAKFEGKVQELRARWAEIKVKEDDSKRRLEASLANVKTQEERNRITAAWNQENAGILHEKNQIAREANLIDQQIADAKTTSAGAYAEGVRQRPAIAAIHAGGKGKGPSVQQQVAAEKAAIQKVSGAKPEWAAYVNKYGDQLQDRDRFGPFTGSEAVPADLREAVRKEKERMLQAAFPGYTEPLETDVEEPEI